MNKSYLLTILVLILISTYSYAQPDNDNCADAIAVSFGPDQPFSTVNANTDGPEHPSASCYSFGNQFCNKEIWYTITAANTGSIEFSTCNTASFDTRLAVYNPGSSCPPVDADLLACNDDGPGCDNFTSKIDFPAEAGETYLICIGGYDIDETGDGTFSLEEIATPIPPPNNNCADSEEILVITPEQAAMDEGWVEGNNEDAPSVLGGLSCLPMGEFYDVWYHFDTGTEDLLTVVFEKLDVDSDYHVEIWKNDCETAAISTEDGGVLEQVCWDQNETTAGSLVLTDFTTAPGIYKLRVATQITNFTPGSFQIQIVAGTPIGISELNITDNQVSIYPNPNNGIFNIEISENVNNATIVLMDMQGRSVYNETGNFMANQPYDFNTDFLSKGIYALSILNENLRTVAVKKVVIE